MLLYPKEHARGKWHKAALLRLEYERSTDDTIAESIFKIQQQMQMQGSLLNKDTKLFRMKAVQLMYQANISVNALDSVGHQLEKWASSTLGGRRALLEYCEMHHWIWKEHVKNCVSKLCFPQYSTMTDGTPCFASAEGMKLRIDGG
jgi:hypothetical protein